MRRAFCGKRIRDADYAELVKRTGGRVFYHYAEEGPHRNCYAAAMHRGERLGVRPTIYTDEPQEVKHA